MKSGNKLNKALKEALDTPAALNDKQWERLRTELDGKEPKRKFLPWLVSLLLVFTVLLGSLLYYATRSVSDRTSMEQGNSAVKGENAISNEETGKASETDQGSALEHTDQGAINETDEGQNGSGDSHDANKSVTIPDSKQKMSTGGGLNASKIGNDAGKPTGTEANGRLMEKKIPVEENDRYTNLSGISKKNILYDSEQGSFAEYVLPMKPKYAKLRKKKPVKTIVLAPAPRNRFAIGIASGLSTVKTSVSGISNEEKLHKDTRSLFEQSTANQSSFFTNLIFDCRILKGLNLGLSTGVQYREVRTDMDVSYKLNQIPFRDLDGNISFYIMISDTMNPLVLSLTNTTSIKFVNVPLKLSYAFYVKNRNEIQLSGGLNFSVVAGSRGETFSINEARTRPVYDMIDKLYNFGFTGGLMYSRNIKGNWWLGTELQMQKNNLNYNMDYGVLNSKMKINNFNLNLRYKF